MQLQRAMNASFQTLGLRIWSTLYRSRPNRPAGSEGSGIFDDVFVVVVFGEANTAYLDVMPAVFKANQAKFSSAEKGSLGLECRGVGWEVWSNLQLKVLKLLLGRLIEVISTVALIWQGRE